MHKLQKVIRHMYINGTWKKMKHLLIVYLQKDIVLMLLIVQVALPLLEVIVPYVYNRCFYFPLRFTPNDGINDIYEISSFLISGQQY